MAKFVRARANRSALVPHLDRFFARAKFPDSIDLGIRMNKPQDTAYHPSSKGDTIASIEEMYAFRRLVPTEYQVTPREREVMEPGSIKNFLVGHMWHELMQWAVVDGLGFAEWDSIEKSHAVRSDGNPIDQNSEKDCDSVTKLMQAGGWWAKGAIDVARCEIPGMGTFLVDFKTCGSFPFKSATVPYENYIAQLQIYMDWEGVDRGIILYINKDSGHDFKEFVIERDPAVAENIYRKWDIVSQAVVDGALPKLDSSERATV